MRNYKTCIYLILISQIYICVNNSQGSNVMIQYKILKIFCTSRFCLIMLKLSLKKEGAFFTYETI